MKKRNLTESEKAMWTKNIARTKIRQDYLAYKMKYLKLMIDEGLHNEYLEQLKQKEHQFKQFENEFNTNKEIIKTGEDQIKNGVEIKENKEQESDDSGRNDN